MKLAASILTFCVAALLALGIVMLYSSSMAEAGARYLGHQLMWLACGLCLAGMAASMDYRFLKKVNWPLLAFATVLLVLVFVPHLGVRANGARRWIGYAGLRFQCSELAKIALIITLAWYGERYRRQMPGWKRGIVIPALFILPVLALIFVEKDRGTTILLAAACASVLLVAGVKWRYIVPPLMAAATALAFSLWNDPVRSRRIFSWLSPEEHKSGAGYQAYQAMIAFGAGGWSGLGLGNGRQKLGFVPEHHTDFILSIIGEELGLIATLLVVVAFVAIVICGIYIALRAPDTFGLLLGSGLTFLIGLQAFINIGVVTSALPNKGLPLPFISYGGSNLLMMLGSVGLLLSIARRAHVPEPGTEPAPDVEDLPSGNPFAGPSHRFARSRT